MRARRIYLDHNATTPVRAEVLEAMLPCFRERFGNPSSIHREGQAARRALEQARAEVAALVGAGAPSEIVFTASGTEADNLALRAAVARRRAEGRSPRVVTSAIEHSAVLRPCEALAREGICVELVPPDADGVVDPARLVAALAADGGDVVSLQLANSDVGTLQPVAELARLARGRGALVHCDAVQAAGRIAVDVEELGVDLLSLSGHKLGGPKGAGALFVRRGLELAPLLLGGDQERGRRAGTENVPALVGFGRACALAAAERAASASRTAALRDRLERGILARVPGARVNGGGAARLPNTLNVTLPDVDGESLLMNLDLLGIAASAGSACSSGSEEPSHVLLAMGVGRELARASLRFSLGADNTEAEIDAVIDTLAELVPRLRGEPAGA
jgi:cysteine desulfurase